MSAFIDIHALLTRNPRDRALRVDRAILEKALGEAAGLIQELSLRRAAEKATETKDGG